MEPWFFGRGVAEIKAGIFFQSLRADPQEEGA